MPKYDICYPLHCNLTYLNLDIFLDGIKVDWDWGQVGSGGRAVERRTVNRWFNPTYRRFET